MTINEFLQKYRKTDDFGYNLTRPRVKCADGFTVSVQAGVGIYSDPRSDASHYNSVELGYPDGYEEEWHMYAEDPEEKYAKETVYGFVPVEVVDSVLEKHGGIAEADFSNVKNLSYWGEGDTTA